MSVGVCGGTDGIIGEGDRDEVQRSVAPLLGVIHRAMHLYVARRLGLELYSSQAEQAEAEACLFCD